MPNQTQLWSLCLCVILFTALLSTSAEAQMRGKGRFGERAGGMGQEGRSPEHPVSADGVEERTHDVTASELTPVFPDSYECEPISSPYGSPYRHDGSKRRDDRNGGLHGGMDLTLNEGSPLLAVAAGEVIVAGEGGRLEGIFLWLRHAPEDTGLPTWVFSKYQHLSELPKLKAGDRVRAGDVIALSGMTGTAGLAFGPGGYPHLHLSTFYGKSGEFQITGMFNSQVHGDGAVLDDPMIMHVRSFMDVQSVRALPEDLKKIPVAIKGDDGGVVPADSKVVWPVPCKRK